jgi:uncharacterized protein DUF1569
MQKTLFDKQAYDEIGSRLEKLKAESPRQWGKMDVSQMLAHCIEAIKMPLDHTKQPRKLISYLIGGIIKKNVVSPEPYKQGLPTAKDFIITDKREFEKEKQSLLGLLKRFHEAGEKGMTPHAHPFFGPMTPHEWGCSQYKHIDHHLRQFNA